MRKYDKLIVIIGVIILLVSSIGIYFLGYDNPEASSVEINDIMNSYGVLMDIPDSISASNDNPFNAIIATPLAVHYDKEGKREVIPLYIENIDNPSKAVIKLQHELERFGNNNLIVGGITSPKKTSLEIADKYWERSKTVLIIENNTNGYCLGLIATPIASYLSIPIIITDEVDGKVIEVLANLGVENTIICGENLSGYGNVLKFNNVEEIIDAKINLTLEKFGKIDYITLTNPIDAWHPKVLDRVNYTLGPVTLKSISINKLVQAALAMLTGSRDVGSFIIPEDYKYALIKFEGINHELEGIEQFGDSVGFNVASNSHEAPTDFVITGNTGTAGNPIRDASGTILKDRLVQEAVLYDQGGVECFVTATGSWSILKEGQVSANVVVEKLENPVYPMMKNLSSIAPYLTAYHQGIIFGKPEFSFTADDDVITDKGNTCPGFYVPRRNSPLVPMSNRHIFDNIHDPLNEILAKIADISIEDERNIEILKNHYQDNPIYVTIVGGATVIPNYIYQNHVEPFGDVDNDGIDDTPYWIGGGTPSDVIYGNIDPIRYDWSNLANDIYSTYPFMENIVARITGWDAQDASALIVRAFFYNEIIENYDNWKDNFGLLVGGGQDFQKPLIRQILFENILGLVPPGEPIKLFTGYGEQSLLRTEHEVAEPLGFNVQSALYEEAMRKGLSDDAISQIKNSCLLNKILFNERLVRQLAGEGNVKGGDIYETSNFIFANGHGCQNFYGMAGDDLTSTGLGGPIVREILLATLTPALGGFMGPGADLGKVGDYNCREVTNMEMGPSFLWLESCICGKIDGMFPKASITQAHLHSGIVSMVASSTGSNIGGGYLEPKNMKYDIPIITKWKYFRAKNAKWENDEYDTAHFGFRLYGDLCEDLRKNNVSIGLAFRNSRNNYFVSEEIDWEVWWTPPLIKTGNDLLTKIDDLFYQPLASNKGPMIESKYVSYQEYLLFGDPALNLYEPVNEGQ